MSAAELIPAWRLIHAVRFLCRKLSSHHSPRPMRRTAAHWGPVSQVVFMPLVLAPADLGIHTPPPPRRRRAAVRTGQPRWMRLKRDVTTGSDVASSRHTV